MQAIITKYIPATNCRGSRIKATCERGSLTLGYSEAEDYAQSGKISFGHSIGEDRVHIVAVLRLIERFIAEDAERYASNAEQNPWGRPFVTGQIPSGEYVHVFTA